MNKKQKIKLVSICSFILILGVAVSLILYALKQNINLFYTPTQLASTPINTAQNLRVGGYVQKHSVHFDASGSGVDFIIMDPQNAIHVSFKGVLPNLFREGQGVVVTGRRLNAREFQATEVLAKHDEKYVPRYLTKDMDEDFAGNKSLIMRRSRSPKGGFKQKQEDKP